MTRIAQCGRTGGVGADVVALDDVSGPTLGELDAVVEVAGDQVALTGQRATDRDIQRAATDMDAVPGIAHLHSSRVVGPDVVAVDERSGRRRIPDVDAVGVVARDHVACAGRGTADAGADGAAVDADTVRLVADFGDTVGAYTDVVAFDDVVVCTQAGNHDTGIDVARDHIARICRRATDTVAAGATEDDCAMFLVGDHRDAIVGDTDVIALDDVVVRAGVADCDTVAEVA